VNLNHNSLRTGGIEHLLMSVHYNPKQLLLFVLFNQFYFNASFRGFYIVYIPIQC
jgi:hypothetical protein